MLKQSGFTLIELMTVISILGILFVITVPEYQILRGKNEFRAQNQAVWDQIATARSAALTNKKCSDDSVAVAWQVFITGVNNSTALSHTLNCVNGSDFEADLYVEEAAATLTSTEADILEIDGVVIADLATSTIVSLRINFLSGSAQTRIETVEPTETPEVVRIDAFRIAVGHTATGSSLQQTLCLERVGGFPTINKNGNICEEDA